MALSRKSSSRNVLLDQLRPNQPTITQLIPFRIRFPTDCFRAATTSADRPACVRRPARARRCRGNNVFLPLPQKCTSFSFGNQGKRLQGHCDGPDGPSSRVTAQRSRSRMPYCHAHLCTISGFYDRDFRQSKLKAISVPPLPATQCRPEPAVPGQQGRPPALVIDQEGQEREGSARTTSRWGFGPPPPCLVLRSRAGGEGGNFRFRDKLSSRPCGLFATTDEGIPDGRRAGCRG